MHEMQIAEFAQPAWPGPGSVMIGVPILSDNNCNAIGMTDFYDHTGDIHWCEPKVANGCLVESYGDGLRGRLFQGGG